jgi:hypothetical protein
MGKNKLDVIAMPVIPVHEAGRLPVLYTEFQAILEYLTRPSQKKIYKMRIRVRFSALDLEFF